MSIRPHPTKPAGNWYIDVGHGKTRGRIPFTGTLEEAKEAERQIRASRGMTITASDPRVREIADKYMTTYRLDHLKAGSDKQQERVDLIVRYFGAYNLTSITPQLVEQFKTWRMTTVKPITINKELSALSGICKWAQEAGYILNLPRIKRFSPKLARSPIPKIPDAETINRIIDCCTPRLRELFRLSFMAGLRPGEATSLMRDNWIADLQILRITGKGNKTRHIPIVNAEMAAELTRRAENTKSGYLWESPWTESKYTDIRMALKAAAKRAGWNQDIHPHLLRHSAATDLIDKGVDVSIVQQILGHSTIKVTETYLHIRHNMMADAMRKRESVDRICQEKEP